MLHMSTEQEYTNDSYLTRQLNYGTEAKSFLCTMFYERKSSIIATVICANYLHLVGFSCLGESNGLPKTADCLHLNSLISFSSLTHMLIQCLPLSLGDMTLGPCCSFVLLSNSIIIRCP